MTIRSLVLIMVGLAIAFFQPVSAEPPGTVIKHINLQKKTVTLELYRPEQGTREIQVYKVDWGCIITLDGQTAKLKDLRVGEHVTGLTEGDIGLLDALHVRS